MLDDLPSPGLQQDFGTGNGLLPEFHLGAFCWWLLCHPIWTFIQ